ncbi:unnamed protein product [Acanthoscelides obtectus]|uniref:DDE Tnp4 domain-containing protein n=1 Tax=Acanthoscelides obtectus TaxID=200917 RepID=A0A9P0LUS8_ACAOB|nr:unnamed protein product [Acanthoscelides obtectus]CAK1620539.1 Protein ALP1-like [Acanthoscelides obtectus]
MYVSASNKRYLLGLLYLRRKYRQAKKVRQHWVHPLLTVRYLEGSFYTLFEKLRKDNSKFFNYFRMSIDTFDFIVERLLNSIKHQNTPMRACIPPKEMVAVTIRYLASGATFTDMHYYYRIGISTISKTVRLVCNSLWNLLKDEFLPQPTEETWQRIADNFKKSAQFPNCLGAIDGKHIRVNRFPHSGSMNLNYKGYFSIILMAVVDSDYKFIYVDIGAYGKDCDSSVFQQTVFFKLMMENKLHIPPPCPLEATGKDTFPYVFVGDEAFGLSENLMRPYAGHNLTEKKRIFNYRLTRARRYVECAFGIISNKWRILHRALNVSKQLSKDIVKACVVLHNVVRIRDADNLEMYVSQQKLPNVQIAPCTRPTKNANYLRDCLADYFVTTEGMLPWQMDKI